MGPGTDVAGTLLRCLDRGHDLVALFDADVRLLWMNRFGLDLLGYRLDDVVGRSGFDFLHPDDLPRATLNVARAFDATDENVWLRPAPVRLLSASGRYLRVQLSSGAVTAGGEGGPALALIGREDTEAGLNARLVSLLTAEAPSEQAFALVPEFGRWRLPTLWHAVFHLDDAGHPAATGSSELVELFGPVGSPAWPETLGPGDTWYATVADLPEALRAPAAEAGLACLGVEAVADPLHDRLAVAAFAQHVGSPNAGNLGALVASQYSLESVAAILALVLSWRNQVLLLRRAAATDPLTGLANRAGFFAHWRERAGADALVPGAVLSIDLDGFKQVNDTHGHPVGDELLVEVAARIGASVRPTDVVARLGGDEFVVVAPLVSQADADAMAERIVAHLSTPFRLRGHDLRIGASIGVAAVDEHGEAPERTLERADRALYGAKAAGRGTWRRAPRWASDDTR